MRVLGIGSAVFVSLLLGIGAPALAEHGPQGKQGNQSAQQQSRYQPSRYKQRKSKRAEEEQRVRNQSWQQHRARSWESDHRTWQQRGGYQGHRVTDMQYRRYFGPQNAFRINTLPFRVVSGEPRFRYRGYWMTVVDPWPEYWSNDWYNNDDVYVSSVNNGYYLVNPRHPNVQIALRISI